MGSFTKISNFFIDNYFDKASPAFVLVYIALLRFKEDEKEAQTFRLSDVADKIGAMQADVLRAVRHWESVGVLRVAAQGNDEVSISFNTENYVGFSSSSSSGDMTSRGVAVVASKPVYSNAEIDYYLDHNDDLRRLFKSCENQMGKLLSYNDMCALFSLHDWLRMSFELIELLVEYCCANEHRSIRYIESVAVTWFDAGITTTAAAKERIKLYNKDFRQIMAAFGKQGREPVKAETEYMLKWLKLYKMPMDVVLLACEKTVLNTSRPTFKYADAIIESWYNAGVSSVDDANAHDETFKGANAANAAKQPTRAKKTRFSNFKERDTDNSAEFDEIRRLEAERIAKELEN